MENFIILMKSQSIRIQFNRRRRLQSILKPLYFSSSVIITLFSYLHYVLSIIQIPILDISQSCHKDLTLFVAICSTNRTIKRVFNLMDVWGDDFTKSKYYGGIIVMGTYLTNVPIIKQHLLFVPPGTLCDEPKINDNLYGKVSYILAQYFVYACQYFVEHSSASFLVRTMDDTFIHLDNLKYLFEYFEKRNIDGDTPLFIGNCMDESNYLQGGSGYLVSRATAKRIAEVGVEWIKTMKEVEDRDIWRLAKMTGIHSIYDGASPFFIGHLSRNFAKTPFNSYKKCVSNDSITMNHCRFEYMSLKKIVFWHDDYHVLKHKTFKKFIDKIPETLSYYPNGDYPVFCHF